MTITLSYTTADSVSHTDILGSPAVLTLTETVPPAAATTSWSTGAMNPFFVRLSPSPCPWVAADVVGSSTIYLTDGVAAPLTEVGPWPANLPRDVFVNPSWTAIQSQPWRTSAAMPPQSSFGQYVGSINPDSNGLLSCHVTMGPSRRRDVFSAINMEMIDILVEDGAANIAESSPQASWAPITPNSFGTIITGLPTTIQCLYRQSIYTLAGPSGGSAWGCNAIGWGSSFASAVPWSWPNMAGQPPGTWGQTGIDNYSGGQEGPSTVADADYSINGWLGPQSIYAIVCANTIAGAGSTVTYMGKNPPVERCMRIRFRG